MPRLLGNGPLEITSGVPIQFSSVSDPSHTDSLAGFTYYHRFNGGAYTSSTSPEFLLPSYTASLSYTVDGYVQDKDGGTSPVYTTVTTVSAGTVVGNHGTGTVKLNGTITIGPNQYYASTGMLGSVQLTLQTSGATYNLYSTGNITGIDAAAGVSAVQVNVHTDVSGTSFVVGLSPAPGSSTAMPPLSFYGHGDIGDIVLPAGSSTAGSSTLSVASRGDLSSISGPSGTGKLWAQATSLYFGSLSGSITGLDHIQSLLARGWLGDSASDQVAVNAGIDTLSAYGVAATVTADRNYDQSDPSSTVSVGHGGVSGVLSLGNVLGVTLSGTVNQVKVGRLMGDFLHSGPGDVALLALTAVQAQPGADPPKLKDVNKLGDHTDVVMAEVGRGDNFKIGNIAVSGKLDLEVKGSLNVSGNILAGRIEQLAASKNLSANRISALSGKIEGKGVKVGGDLTVAVEVAATAGITRVEVGGSLTGGKVATLNGNIDAVVVGKKLAASVVAESGTIGTVSVGSDFTLGGNPLVRGGKSYLLRAQQIDKVTVGGDVRSGFTAGLGNIAAETIGQVKVGGNLYSNVITEEVVGGGGSLVQKDIGQVEVGKQLLGEIKAQGGDIGLVKAKVLKGAVRAQRASNTDLVLGDAGGSIGRVELGEAVERDGKNAVVEADNYLGAVKFTGNGKTEVDIRAQAGAAFDENNKIKMPGGNVVRTALKVESKALFKGTIRFAYGRAPKEFRVAFGDRAELLEFKDVTANKTQLWLVRRNPGSTENAVNLADVAFKLANLKPGDPQTLEPQRLQRYTKPNTEPPVQTGDWYVAD